MRHLLLAFIMGSLVFGLGCGSKKKKADADPGSIDSEISSRDGAYDSLGSDSGNIKGLNSIFFEYDRAALTTNTRKRLAENADWIKSQKDLTIQVEGHCDARGSVEYNLALGERRAKAVKNYLVSLGINAKRLTIISYGKEKPLSSGDSESDLSKNRRANFVPLPN